jgi:transposase
MPQSRTLDVGMAVHTDAIAVASVAPDPSAAVVCLGTLGSRHGDLAQLIRKLPSKSQPLVFVYEAGPCGAWLSRSLTQTGPLCWGVAPSLIPPQAGNRVNTDRRDAVPRARSRRSGALPPVSVPKIAAAAAR